MKFQSIVASALSIACSFCVLTSLANHTASTDDLGQEINVDGTLTVSSTIDLQGKSVTYLGVTGFSGTGSFTNGTDKDQSILTIDVGSSSALKCQFNVKGNIRLIKGGTGSFYFNLNNNSYTGGTEIEAGKLYTDKYANVGGKATDNTSFGVSPQIYVAEGAEIDFGGAPGYNFTTITLDGGSITGPNRTMNSTKPLAATITLKKDSKITTSKVFRYCGSISLGEKVLTISAGDALYFESGTTIANGTIKVSKGTITLTDSAGSSTASLTLDAGTKIVGDFVYSVKDFVIDSTASVEGPVHVYGTYKPATVDAYMPVMQDGSTLDLSGFSGAVEIDASHFGTGNVTVYVGDRTLTDNETIIKWAGAPADTTFVLEGDNVTKKYEATATGLVYNPASDTIDKAVWTGAGADPTDYMAADNWACYSSDGTSLPGKVPETTMTVTFTGDVSKVSMTADFPFAGVNFDDAKLSSNADWLTFELAKISNGSIIDLAGNRLEISGEGTSTSAATFTDTIGGGVLTFQVDEGKVFDNETLNFAGYLQLTKTGAGSFVATKDDQTYSGGTVVKAGVLKSGMQNLTDKSPFGSGEIAVESGAYLDPAGGINWKDVVIVLNGGAISNSVASTGRGSSVTTNPSNPFNPTIKLNQKSTLMTDKAFNFQGEIVSENQELDVEIYGGNTLLWNPKSATNLCVNVTKGGWFQVWNKAAVSYTTQRGMTLMMTGGALDLCQKSTSGTLYPATMDVENYFAGYTENPNNSKDAGTLNVHGTFTPAGLTDDDDYFFGCTLLDGATINLSERSAAWVNKSAFAVGPKAVTFADGATITIALGEREAKIGEELINWGEGKPTNLDSLEFLVTGENIEEGAILVRDDEAGTISLASADKTVATAEWVGGYGVEFSNPLNWICRNAAGKEITEGDPLPTADTVVRMQYTVLSETQFPTNKPLVCKAIEFSGDAPSPLTLSADTDWRGLGAIDFPCAIDLNGFKLFLTLKNGTSAEKLSVTGAGELHATVLEDATYANTSVSFGGELSFIKEGAGTFVASVTNQTYAGETKVTGGVLASGIDDLKEATPFGEKKAVTVEENGALDPRGSYNWTTDFVITLNGGMISNTVERTGVTTYTQFNAGSNRFTEPFNPTLDLGTDSIFASTKTFNFKGTVKGNGRVLTVKAGELRWVSHDSTEAIISFMTNTVVKTLENFPMTEKDVSIAMDGAKFDFGSNWSVSNYIAKSTSAVSNYRGAASDNFNFKVYGAFCPETSDFLGCVMQDGSTLDLTAQEGAFNLYNAQGRSNLTKGVAPWLCQHVTFAEGAKVTIDVHGRTFKNGDQIISWTEETKPANLGEFTLILDAESKKDGYRLMPTADGISVERSGMLLMLK